MGGNGTAIGVFFLYKEMMICLSHKPLQTYLALDTLSLTSSRSGTKLYLHLTA